MSRHLIPRLTLGEAESLVQKHGRKGEGMRIFSILVDADKILHDKGVEISKTHAVVPIADIQRSNADLRRLRIAHLRRMADAAQAMAKRWSWCLDSLDAKDVARISSNAERYRRFADACRAEIAGLRGDG